jgi:hypothetical protein
MATTLTNAANAKCLSNLCVNLDTLRIVGTGAGNCRLSDLTGSGGSGSGWSGTGTGVTNKSAWPSALVTALTGVGFRLLKSSTTLMLAGDVALPGLSGDGTWPTILAGDTINLPTGAFVLAYT